MSPPPSRLVRTVFPGKPAGATFFEWGQKARKGTGFSGNFVRTSPRGTICTRSLPASNAGAEEAEKTTGVMNLSLRDRVRLHQDRAPKFLSPGPTSCCGQRSRPVRTLCVHAPGWRERASRRAGAEAGAPQEMRSPRARKPAATVAVAHEPQHASLGWAWHGPAAAPAVEALEFPTAAEHMMGAGSGSSQYVMSAIDLDEHRAGPGAQARACSPCSCSLAARRAPPAPPPASRAFTAAARARAWVRARARPAAADACGSGCRPQRRWPFSREAEGDRAGVPETKGRRNCPLDEQADCAHEGDARAIFWDAAAHGSVAHGPLPDGA